ncbi:hypothetical protein BIW11_03328 [Tropilaelaps mercedesae]|uniref:RRM domain-containing protein n=1 Tax=Tropilaelaps mercedesae TaxID=418985 RepID=A0A1V9XNP2_9ACAR|nr:hypothetical protein BIW11_03328 [Tropilaelaps mercedesae]
MTAQLDLSTLPNADAIRVLWKGHASTHGGQTTSQSPTGYRQNYSVFNDVPQSLPSNLVAHAVCTGAHANRPQLWVGGCGQQSDAPMSPQIHPLADSRQMSTQQQLYTELDVDFPAPRGLSQEAPRDAPMEVRFSRGDALPSSLSGTVQGVLSRPSWSTATQETTSMLEGGYDTGDTVNVSEMKTALRPTSTQPHAGVPSPGHKLAFDTFAIDGVSSCNRNESTRNAAAAQASSALLHRGETPRYFGTSIPAGFRNASDSLPALPVYCRGLSDSPLGSVSGSTENGGPSSQSSKQRYEMALARLTAECRWRRKCTQPARALVYWNSWALPSYSRQGDLTKCNLATKVFLGGLPYDATHSMLMALFSSLGVTSIQVPPARKGSSRRPGHAYLVFEDQTHVRRLLNNCTMKGAGLYFFWVPSTKTRGGRLAQVIPWATEDNDWVEPTVAARQDAHGAMNSCLPPFKEKGTCIFVGGLHGEVSAEGLQLIMSQLFGPVLHAGIDTDCHGGVPLMSRSQMVLRGVRVGQVAVHPLTTDLERNMAIRK